MPVYKYTAKNIQTKVIKGTREAATDRELSAALHDEGLYLISFTEAAAEYKSVYHPKPNELADFTLELGMMLSAGITLIRALSIILESDMKPPLKALYQNVYTLLQRGESFSDALEAQRGAFPPLMINMFRAGEASGKMDASAKKIALHYQKDHKTRSKVKNAMIYPVILITVGILVFLGIFVFILPQFMDKFYDMGVKIPKITEVMFAISNSLVDDWLIWLFAVIGIILCISFALKSPKVQLWIDKTKLRLPKIGGLMKTIYTARFARTLSTLYTSGLSIMQSLAVASETIGNKFITGQFGKVIAQVRSGAPLSRALKEVQGFSPKLSSVTLIGEESGKLDEMLDNMADNFDYESEKAIDRLVAMMEPVMIVILAIAVGIIMVSVLLPVYSMYQSFS